MFVCKVCDYEREDKPEESWDTCPNCDSFDWMVNGERNNKKWTTDPPTEEGWYWVWGYRRQYTKEGLVYPPTVEYVKKDGEKFVIHGDDYNSGVEDYYHWLGPLPVPEPPKE